MVRSDGRGPRLGVGRARIGSPAFDHGRMLFERISFSVQRELTCELSHAHTDLQAATNRLKVATWWLLIVTVVLGVIEVVALLRH
jgi:hypothetical protein